MPFRRGGFRKFGPRLDIPKPVKVGEEYDVEINEVGSKGDGIARIKNFVVFITGAKQGEKTRIKIKEVRNRFAVGEKVSGEEKVAEAEEEPVESKEVEEEGEGEKEE
jgi:predicted RNA-binding protein with TRAM domain